MICLLCNGDGSIGGGGAGGVSITNRLLLGVDFEIQIGLGRVAEEMTDLPKNYPAPQLINNDWPLRPK